jgi:all-trans-retinol dehydrogenase (NAD+)
LSVIFICKPIILVTGGAQGLGKEIAIALARENCNVAIADIDEKAASLTAQEISETFNVKAKSFQCDISNFEAVQKLKADIESSLGCVDILINNAGLLALTSLKDDSPEYIGKVLDVNLRSHFWVSFQ